MCGALTEFTRDFCLVQPSSQSSLGIFGGPLDRDFCWGFWRLGIFGIVVIAIVVNAIVA